VEVVDIEDRRFTTTTEFLGDGRIEIVQQKILSEFISQSTQQVQPS